VTEGWPRFAIDGGILDATRVSTRRTVIADESTRKVKDASRQFAAT